MTGYTVRSLAQLAAEAVSGFTQAVQGTAAKLTPNVWRVEAKVLALLGFEHEQRRAYLYDQIFAHRAARAWLIRHGYELGLGGPAPATKASGTVLVPAIAGLAVPAGLVFQGPNATTYTTVSADVAEGSLVALPVEADTPGAAGNLAAGFPLTLVPDQDVPPGLGTRAVVDTAGLAGGADAEETETYRAKVLDRKRRPPQGGSATDYATWASEALGPGILRAAYVDSFVNDTRSVWLCFTVTDQPDGIPTEGQVALVQAYCDDPIRRPVTARVFALGPVALPVDVTVAKLAPDTDDVRGSVEDEIKATFLDRAAVSTATRPLRFSRSWISEGIARAVGEDAHELPVPDESVAVPIGHLPVPGVISFV